MKSKSDPYKFWKGKFPDIDASATKKSASQDQHDGALSQLEDLEMSDINQIMLLCNPQCMITNLKGDEIKLDGTWRMQMIKGRPTFFPCKRKRGK